jgi:hypothetical protein
MPLYIVSGIVMLVSAYFSFKYRPYCMLKSPEREIAMELRRKKLRTIELGVKNEMSNEEEKQYDYFMHNHYLNGFWQDQVLHSSASIHILLLIVLSVSSLEFANLIPIYFTSGFLIVIGTGAMLPAINGLNIFCTIDTNGIELEILNSHHEQIHGQILYKEDERNIKNTKWEANAFRWREYSLLTGLLIHLYASLLLLVTSIIK